MAKNVWIWILKYLKIYLFWKDQKKIILSTLYDNCNLIQNWEILVNFLKMSNPPPPLEHSRKLSDGFIRDEKKVLVCNEMASNIYNCVTFEKKKESTVLGSVETEVNKF